MTKDSTPPTAFKKSWLPTVAEDTSRLTLYSDTHRRAQLDSMLEYVRLELPKAKLSDILESMYTTMLARKTPPPKPAERARVSAELPVSLLTRIDEYLNLSH